MNGDNLLEVWFLPFSRIAQLPRRLLRLLGRCEIDRCRVLARESDRVRFVLSHALLRCAIGGICRVAPRLWELVRQESGEWKAIEPPVPIQFSLTHTEGIVAVAVSRRHRIGLDIEPLTGSMLSPSIAAMFSSAELAWLNRLPMSVRWKESIRLWTAKEAHAKLTGLGADTDFPSVRIEPTPPPDSRLWCNEIAAGGQLFQLSLMVGRGASVELPPRIRRVELTELERLAGEEAPG